jgi:hypothetical protein
MKGSVTILAQISPFGKKIFQAKTDKILITFWSNVKIILRKTNL